MRRIDRLVPIMLLCAPLSCAAAERLLPVRKSLPCRERRRTQPHLLLPLPQRHRASNSGATTAGSTARRAWNCRPWGRSRMCTSPRAASALLRPFISGKGGALAACSRICAMTRTQSRAHRSRPLCGRGARLCGDAAPASIAQCGASGRLRCVDRLLSSAARNVSPSHDGRRSTFLRSCGVSWLGRACRHRAYTRTRARRRGIRPAPRPLRRAALYGAHV